MKKTILSIFLFLLLMPSLGAETQPAAASAPAAAPSPNAATPAPEVQPTEENLETRLAELKNLKSKKEFFAAGELIEKILQMPDLPEDQVKSLKEDYAEIRAELLLAQIEVPEDQIYTVVAGDSLYKIALKYKTTVGFIKKINRLKKDVVYVGMKLKVPSGEFMVAVDKSDNVLFLYFNDKLLKQYSVATGKNNRSPVGTFKITDKLENPTWYHDGKVHKPGSEENILGSRWLGFDKKSYGIHGTTLPETIGQQASDGCVRMRNEDVEEVYALIPSGTKVIVRD